MITSEYNIVFHKFICQFCFKTVKCATYLEQKFQNTRKFRLQNIQASNLTLNARIM